MVSAIAIRTQSSDDELILGRNDPDLASFILQIRNPHRSPQLLKHIQDAIQAVLADLGSDTKLVPVEPIADYLPAHLHTHYEARVEEAIDHPPMAVEHGMPYSFASSPGAVSPEFNKLLVVADKAGHRPADTGTVRNGSSSGHEASRQALARGEERLVKWTKDGTLVDGKRLSDAWGISRQGLDKARSRGEIFSVRVKSLHYYPAEAEHFRRDDLAEINYALGEIDPASKLIFLKRKHGALGGCTPAEAVEKGKIMDVLRLAKDWTDN